MISFFNFFIIALGGLAAGFVNAIAGGGTLISFPVLTFIGIPPILANVTNTVSLSPGYLSASLAQLKDIKDQKRYLFLFVPIAAFGGILGGVLLLLSSDKLFESLIPYLILLASVLLAFQDTIKKWLIKPNPDPKKNGIPLGALVSVFIASVYGGYFGAGLSVIVLAVLALFINDCLTRLNALKQAIGFSVNIFTSLFFIFSGQILWLVVLVMTFGAITGGWIGGKLVKRIKPKIFRFIVVSIGFIVSIIYFLK